jgi:RHS repeat-associated protein
MDATNFWPTQSWTLYFRDGSKVQNDHTINEQKYFDRNGRWIKYTNVVNGGTANRRIEDEYGRWINIARSGSADVVTSYAHNDLTNPELIWTVNWSTFSGPLVPYRVNNSGLPVVNPALPNSAQVVSSVVTPNGQQYSFEYNTARGELKKVTLPAGAYTSYTYDMGEPSAPPGDRWWYQYLENRVASKTLTYNQEYDGTSVPQVDSWSYPISGLDLSVIGPLGIVVHRIIPVDYRFSSPTKFSGSVTKTTQPDGSYVERIWAENIPVVTISGTPVVKDETYNAWVKAEYRTAASAGSPVTKALTVFSQDKNGNDLCQAEYNWVDVSATLTVSTCEGNVSGAALIRRALKTYFFNTSDSANASDSNVNSYHRPTSISNIFLGLVASTQINGPLGTESRSEYCYDSVCTGSGSGITLGNRTQERQWDSTRGGLTIPLTTTNTIANTYTYLVGGAVDTHTNPNLVTTKYTYGFATYCGGTGSGASPYPTETKVGFGGPLERTHRSSYNYCSGVLMASSTPALSAGFTTSYEYDRYARVIDIKEGFLKRTKLKYNDQNRWVLIRRDVSTYEDAKAITVNHYDQLGRIRLTRTLETTQPELSDTATGNGETSPTVGGIKVQTRYFPRYVLTSNPFRASTSTAAFAETTTGWSVSRVDGNGRVCRQETFTGVSAPSMPDCANASAAAASSIGTSYSASATSGSFRTVVDNGGATKTYYNDAAGRLLAVVENPGGLAYHTYYTYDGRGNLRTVRQAGTCTTDPISAPCPQGTGNLRTFSYSSLSRLNSAINPESGTTWYTYYWGGQVKTKTDGRTWVTTDTLDELERLKKREYSAASGTSTVDYAYDSEPAGSGCTSGATGYPVDQLKSVSNGDSLTEFGCRDLLGRPRWSRQVTNSVSYPFQYTYQPAGLKEETYPSQLKVETVYDDALRPITVKGTRGSTVTNHVLNAGYTAHGAVSSLPFGNGLTESRTYNGRLQPETIQVGSLLTLNLTYYPTAAGSLKKQIVTRPGSTPWTQDYTYDAIERLKTATETGGGSWSETYDYDERGNRWLLSRTGSLPTPTVETPVAGSWFLVNNRINSWTYDSAGNLNVLPNRTLTYNAENLMTQANVGGQLSTYKYDGEGRRVMKTTPNGTVVFVYDAMGQLAAEYGPTAATGATPGVRYLSQDHLGSTRLMTTSAGAVERNYDYLPFGEEIGAGWAGRSGSFSPGTYPSTPSGVQHKFTGKERDIETGLDYFGARYMSAAQGRFTSPDAPFADQRPENPQSWNLYAYVRNNPLSMVDPTGRNACGHNDDKACKVEVKITDRPTEATPGFDPASTSSINRQGEYNALATVSVTDFKNAATINEMGQFDPSQSTFLAKSTPSDSNKYATAANGEYPGTAVNHHGKPAIAVNSDGPVPITTAVNPNTGARGTATGIRVHTAGIGNFTGTFRKPDGSTGAVSMGCQTICSSQYNGFLQATGLSPRNPSPSNPPQRRFTVIIDTSFNVRR